MSVGGADHCIPQCNHLTLFGSGASVVEFRPQIPLLDASDVSRQERFFHSLKTQRVCPVSPALKALREDRFTGSVPRPFFPKRKPLRFLLGGRPQVSLWEASELSRQER